MKTFLIVVVVGLMILVALAAVGVGAYYLGSKNILSSFLPSPTPLPTKPLVGNDRDAHGCIGSAGYSWCEIKQKCLRTWEEPCSSGTVSQASPSLSPAVDESQTLPVVIKQALVSEHGDTASELVVTVSKIEGNFAKGMASATGGGGLWFGAKVGGVWKLVWDGNGLIYCSDLTPYPDFPVDLIPDCYDKATEKLITR